MKALILGSRQRFVLRGLTAATIILFCGTFSLVYADDFTVTAGNSEITFDEMAGVPVRWAICIPDCADEAARRAVLFEDGDGYFRVSAPGGPGGAFSLAVQESDDEISVEFAAAHGRRVYRLSRADAHVSITLPAGSSIEFATGTTFVPQQLPGFGQMYSRVHGVQVNESGQTIFDDPDQAVIELDPGGDNWVGMRNRYWTLLVQHPVGQLSASMDTSHPDRPLLTIAGTGGDEAINFDFYAGPVEWSALKQVAPVLSEMLFAALWDFLRIFCFGMLLLLDWLQSAVGSFGLAIILLSLANKILLSPLTMLADRWQAEVNRIHTLLKPQLDEIKKNFKGEEAHMRTLDVYKKNKVSQFYTFKSAAGFLIQIPVFIAVFDMLGENIALNEIAFLWVNDLAKPDQLADLPFVLPFFGGGLNILPFLMTGLSVLAAVLQTEDSLSPDLQRQQSRRLYLMSAAFFMLFYTFPAGMVLYWTSSNLFHLLKVELSRLFARAPSVED